MENQKIKNTASKILILLLSISIFSIISAAGISTPYWDSPEDRPFKIAPGETGVVNLNLQNKAGEPQDLTFLAELTEDGKGIASLLDGVVYSVPFGTSINVPVQISIPKDISLGGRRQIEISFKQTSGGDPGMVTLVGGFNTKFPVEIVNIEESALFIPEPAPAPLEEAPSYIYWIVGLIILSIVIIWIVRKRKKK